MGGLEDITEEIINGAKMSAQDILTQAKQKADEIKKANDEEKRIILLKKDRETSEECERIIEMSQASDRQIERQLLLDARNFVIKSIIDEAEKRIKAMSREDYQDFLKEILKNSQTGEDGAIVFSSLDEDALDDSFKKECVKISDGKLLVSEELFGADRGFIIKYGKTEQNCTIHAIIESKYNELTDIVNECVSKKREGFGERN